jgi:hypothetical protein
LPAAFIRTSKTAFGKVHPAVQKVYCNFLYKNLPLRQKLFSLLLFFIGYYCIPLQLNAQPFPNLNFRSITEADGLSDKNVTSIVQDNRGLMWIGTNNGLNRYDGNRINAKRRQ